MAPDLSAVCQRRPREKRKEDCCSPCQHHFPPLCRPHALHVALLQRRCLAAVGRQAAGGRAASAAVCWAARLHPQAGDALGPGQLHGGAQLCLRLAVIISVGPTYIPFWKCCQALELGHVISSFYRTFQCQQVTYTRIHKV